MEDNPALAVGQVLSAQLAQHRQFMKIMLIAFNQGYDLKTFVESLYVWQENMPAPSADDSVGMSRMAKAGMDEWQMLTQMAEEALRFPKGD